MRCDLQNIWLEHIWVHNDVIIFMVLFGFELEVKIFSQHNKNNVICIQYWFIFFAVTF